MSSGAPNCRLTHPEQPSDGPAGRISSSTRLNSSRHRRETAIWCLKNPNAIAPSRGAATGGSAQSTKNWSCGRFRKESCRECNPHATTPPRECALFAADSVSPKAIRFADAKRHRTAENRRLRTERVCASAKVRPTRLRVCPGLA